MELAKLTSKGQVTIPIQIRKKLNLKEGDKIMFIENGNTIQIVNSSLIAIDKLQSAMEGEAEKAGIKNDDDVLALCDDVRKKLYEKHYENND